MATANSNIQITDLDFNSIKSNLKTYLQSQDILKDYNYEGSALNVLLNELAYNTQYNAYYLNMVANEMFLDSALQRSSVVSTAKVLGYTPKSSIGPSAVIKLKINQVDASSLTLPAFTQFMSEAIDGVNYSFVTADSTTVNVTANTAIFNGVILKQGIPANLSYVVDLTANPTSTFLIPNANVDTTTLVVRVQPNGTTITNQLYTLADKVLTLGPTDDVYFLQENANGFYEIYFGDGVLGSALQNGNIVQISYVLTQGTASIGANNFVLMNSVSGYSNNNIYPISSASGGGDQESISSIKFQAPKAYAAQGRAVSKSDYITALQQNNLGFSFDAVNVWGGEENDPPVYGQVFVCLKPTGSYLLTPTQKQRLISDVIKPISVLTVTPNIVDPDYTYLQLSINVFYDPSKTTQTSAQIASGVKASVMGYAVSALNTFNSTFNAYELTTNIQSYDRSIITSEFDLSLQKKFFPVLTTTTSYNLYYNCPIQRGMYSSGINSSPAIKFQDPSNKSIIIDGIYIDELPSATDSIDSISIINPGFNYQAAPTINILGDGTGATAHAVVVNGHIKTIVVDTPGKGYTAAIATVTPASGDTTGTSGALLVSLTGRYGTLRTYYSNTLQVKTIFNPSAGVIDYQKGIVTLNNFNPIDIDNSLGQLTVSVRPTTTIVSSSYNRIITIDPYDPNAITVNVIAKTS